MPASPPSVLLTRREAAEYLIGQLGLRQRRPYRGPADATALLDALRCVQLDPLDRIGTNADLVAMARLEGVRRGEFHRAVLGEGAAFEHFAKERCLLPASAFPWYRQQAVETPWWRHSERMKRLPAEVVAAVLEEVRERGPCTAEDLSDHGSVEPLDWHGWASTKKASRLALEVLWTRCEVVVCGRTPSTHLYDVPARALPSVAEAETAGAFGRWALLERVEAAGLLSTASGPQWSMLASVRTSTLPAALVEEGVLERVEVEGSRRAWLAPGGFRDRSFEADDGAMRILGPLDPLVWDRKLVQHCFGFEYIWEVYKPAATRRWGYYVCPLLHRGRLVGRFEGRVEAGELVCERLWREAEDFDEDAWQEAFERHAAASSGG